MVWRLRLLMLTGCHLNAATMQAFVVSAKAFSRRNGGHHQPRATTALHYRSLNLTEEQQVVSEENFSSALLQPSPLSADERNKNQKPPLPLHHALSEARQELNAMVQREEATDTSAGKPVTSETSREEPSATRMDKAPKVMRLEYAIDPTSALSAEATATRVTNASGATSVAVDPLAWMTAQQQAEASCLSAFYCQNQERTHEVAALGALIACHETSEVWPHLLQQHAEWPRASRFYGGQRFDASSSSCVSPEWQSFGKAWWWLPAVELQREGEELTLAVHVLAGAAQKTLRVLDKVTARCVPRHPPETLPVVAHCQADPEKDNVYNRAVANAIQALTATAVEERDDEDKLRKVVLARTKELRLEPTASSSRQEPPFSALDVLRAWNYGSQNHAGGHLFWMKPEQDATMGPHAEFFGCAPERLFRVHQGTVTSEALAGTRPRGTSREQDQALAHELLHSPKDRSENDITSGYIASAFDALERQGWIQQEEEQQRGMEAPIFVRRLRHVQHLCRTFSARLATAPPAKVAQSLLDQLHPTPAVCGVPRHRAQEFLWQHEGLDRGFYAGPVGFLGVESSDVYVALRSGLLLVHNHNKSSSSSTRLHLYAGGGVVPGSTVQGEFDETETKLSVIASVLAKLPPAQ